MKASCLIHSLGSFVPQRVLTNDDLATLVDTNDQWIVERTGIRERHKLDDCDNASDLGLRAARLALEQINMAPSALSHVIVATCTPDYLTPSVACVIAGNLNAGTVMAFDIGAACTGFIYGISLCRSILCANAEARILFICVEAMSRRLNWTDRSTCVLFGDAAVAAVISSEQSGAICSVEDVIGQSDGTLRDLIFIGGGTACKYQPGDIVDDSFFLSMQGRDTYKHAVRQMVNVCQELLARNGLSVADIDLFVPHQANLRIIEAVGARLKIDSARVFTNVDLYGNTSAASIPLALAEARAQGRIQPGARVMVTAFGAGLTWGAALLQF